MTIEKMFPIILIMGILINLFGLAMDITLTQDRYYTTLASLSSFFLGVLVCLSVEYIKYPYD
jgi:hypothetical protein